MADDYYALLGLSPDAGDEEIRAAFVREIRKWHPDVGSQDGERARQLIEAKAVLTDAERRREYDATLLRGLSKRQRRRAAQFLFVSAHGLGQYQTLSDAVTAANDGDKIYVLPGIYREPLVRIEKRLEIVGQWSDGDDVVIEPPDDGLYLSGSGVTIRSLVFRTREARRFGIISAAFDATVSGCHFEMTDGTGVVVADGSLMIEGSSFEGCQHGVRVEAAHGAVLGAKFRSNVVGVVMLPGADCLIRGSEFRDHAASAIQAQNDTASNISKNEIFGGPAGIVLSATSDGLIDENQFHGLDRSAAVLTPEGNTRVAVAENNSFEP